MNKLKLTIAYKARNSNRKITTEADLFSGTELRVSFNKNEFNVGLIEMKATKERKQNTSKDCT